jgi:hypothetical protein
MWCQDLMIQWSLKTCSRSQSLACPTNTIACAFTVGRSKKVSFCIQTRVFFVITQIREVLQILVLSGTAVTEVKDLRELWHFQFYILQHFLLKYMDSYYIMLHIIADTTKTNAQT